MSERDTLGYTSVGPSVGDGSGGEMSTRMTPNLEASMNRVPVRQSQAGINPGSTQTEVSPLGHEWNQVHPRNQETSVYRELIT